MTGFKIVERAERDQLGEGLIWSTRDQSVYWVDILEPAVNQYCLSDGSLRRWRMPEMIGWLIERRSERGFIAGLKSGFAELTLDPFVIRPIGNPEPSRPRNRLNDACADNHGRIWAGTMNMAADEASGALYCLATDRSWSMVDRGYVVANGPTLSPSQRVLYHTDSHAGVIYRFDVSRQGELLNKRVFVKFEPDWGSPDGMTTDAAGGIWVAHWGGSRLSRFLPDGRLDRSIALPASQITNCVFAGPALDRMFVTSAALNRTDEVHAGMLFEIDPGVTGLPTDSFAG